tara:strand:+ start:1322 stop:1516 length:195 start_codon:yes stop_codon:yes gene_type:complete
MNKAIQQLKKLSIELLEKINAIVLKRTIITPKCLNMISINLAEMIVIFAGLYDMFNKFDTWMMI